ncbi:putative uncharacterized protein DDB_G0271606 [Bombus impatiens]|uniref:Mediator of RNA polymerase II transcription subunit 26 n=1 Tax=Bombus impatiens TaxID=132113 RepID=A0A6P6F9P4_BOMIM|nr:putative uncharacterized protein DDB_G0271606 [Bombus impatiens]
MNKRKASVDRNIRQKASSRRPSTASLHAKPNTVQQKFFKTEKLPSTHNLVDSNDPSKLINKAVDVSMPKTRFSSQDRCKESRSCSSPRLKYFPAEKIKKLESPPPFSPKPIGALIAQQDPRECGIVYVAGHPEQCRDTGQGDATAVTQHVHQHRQPQGVQSVSQQQVVPQQAIHQIGQMNPHSESTLPQQVSNAQSHRPFVPYGSREYSPRKNNHAISSNLPEVTATSQLGIQQVSNVLVMNQGKIKNEDQTNADEVDYEKQPVGGRNAMAYRRAMLNKEQPNLLNPMDPVTLNSPNVDHLHQCSSRSPVLPHTNLQNPQQIYQQLQQNMVQQQQMQQRANNYQTQMMGNQQQVGGQVAPANYNPQQHGSYFPGHGMTSPQDVATSQLKNSRMIGSSQPNHSAMNVQNGWNNNSQMAEHSSIKAQLKPYNVDVVNGNQALCRLQNQQQQLMPQYKQQLAQLQHSIHQQQPVQLQHSIHHQQPVQLQRSVHQQHPMHQYQQLYRNPVQGNAIVQKQQSLMGYNQPGTNQQMNPNQQMVPTQQFNPQQSQDSHPKEQTGRKKPLKFTVAMIRDQEKLLATMKQQGVPLEIMQRQFEMLLNEQRKLLEYVEVLHQQGEFSEGTKLVVKNRKRKQEDEKPEWMIHLTPTRLSYLQVEKIQEQRRREQEAREMEMMQQQQQQHQQQQHQQHQQQQHQQQQHQQQQQQMMGQMSGQQVPVQGANQQYHQHWQQQQANWQQQQRALQNYTNNMHPQLYTVPVPGNVNDPMKSMNYQQNMPQSQYIHQQSHQQYYNQPQLQQYQQLYQPILQENQEHVQSSSQSTEPCSLLKMRQYKNDIRPQRRNNGLQDPAAAKELLENERLPMETRRGLEYLANLAPKKMNIIKLNGLQDRTEAETEFQRRLITSISPPPANKVSANGLANSRNPNNPSSQRLLNPRKIEQEYLKEYPRQKSNIPNNYYSVQAERENGTVATDQPQLIVQQQLSDQNSTSLVPYVERNLMVNRGNVMPFKFDGNYPQHYQQMQQYYQNTKNLGRNNGEGDVGSSQRIELNKGSFHHAGGDASGNMNGSMNGQMAEDKMLPEKVYYSQPDIHESRTIGGVRYLARKQDYLPNQQIVAPETLIANRHVQPPMMY